ADRSGPGDSPSGGWRPLSDPRASRVLSSSTSITRRPARALRMCDLVDQARVTKGSIMKERKVWPVERAAIPGDPCPWEPAVRSLRETGDPATPPGATPSPADSGDPTSFDLGGGD